jgi:hypothetical protein
MMITVKYGESMEAWLLNVYITEKKMDKMCPCEPKRFQCTQVRWQQIRPSIKTCPTPPNGRPISIIMDELPAGYASFPHERHPDWQDHQRHEGEIVKE